MEKDYYIKIAHQNKRMVFGVDLVLSEKENRNEILKNGELLGKVVIETTERFGMDIALPFMDLDVEKHDLLEILDINLSELDKFHFNSSNLSEDTLEKIKNMGNKNPTNRLLANCEAITYVKENSRYLPVGMCIGPFSFITKLLDDAISPVFMKSMGISAEEDISVRTLIMALEVATEIILRSIRLQVEAGAKAVCVCEPAANSVYISPDTLNDEGEDVFDALVLEYNLKIKNLLDENGVDLILHDCGELTDTMLMKLCKLEPVILSLGSSRKLWEDTRIVPKDIVLFGNLPTKQFFLDKEVPTEKVIEITRQLEKKMRETNHPFILGSECDVLSVKGFENTIKDKIELMMTCSGN